MTEMSYTAYEYQTTLPAWYWIIIIAIIAFMIVCRWIVYLKAGEHGWASIIPFYTDYCLCRVAKKPKLFLPYLLTIIGSIVLSFIMAGWIIFTVIAEAARMGLYSNGSAAGVAEILFSIFPGVFVFYIILIAAAIVMLVLQIFIRHGLSVSFGHGAGFTVGLVLLPIVFWAILAFGKSRYIPGGPAAPAGFTGQERMAGQVNSAGFGSGSAPIPNITCGNCGTQFYHDESGVAYGQEFTCFCPNCGMRMQFRKQ